MKKELIKTENYLLVVDDAVIKTWYYDEYSKKVHHSGGAEYSRNDITKNIVAHLPLNGYGILEGIPLLSPLDEGVFITPTHFEFETEITHEGNGTYSTDLMDIGLSNLTPIKVIKTTTNSQGQVVACGKYIY